jgi:hypothetical protein
LATKDRRWRSLVVASCAYLAASLLVWWNVWASHPTSTTICGCGDSSLFTWFLAWPAYAISHGLDPLYSTAMGYPGGVNMLSNTSEVGIGVALAPVTWLFGPVATLNVALALAPVLSAVAMFVLLRRWVTWLPSAFVGGLLYGFSPFIVGSLTGSYLMLGVAAVIPLIVLCLDELLVRQTRSPIITGLVLGLLIALQFFVGTEMLVIVVISGLIGIAMVIAYASWRRPDIVRAKARYAAVGLGAGGISAISLLAYPTWFALAGPAHLSQPIWPGNNFRSIGTVPRDFFVPPPATGASALNRLIGGYQGPAFSHQYFGLGIAAVLIAGLVIWRRDLRLWLFGAMAVIAATLSLGAKTGLWLPWQSLAGLPLLENVIPNRFTVITYFAVAVMVGLIVDHTYRTVAGRRDAALDGPAPATVGHPGARRLSRRGLVVAAAVAAVALGPIAAYLAANAPLTAQPVVLPTWFRTVVPTLRSRQVILVFPAPFSHRESAMTWQAVDSNAYSMVGVGGPGGVPSRSGAQQEGLTAISNASASFTTQTVGPGTIVAVRRALKAWGVTAVVIPDQPHLPAYDQINPVSFAAALVTAATGQLPKHRADAWVWMDVALPGTPALASIGKFTACTAGVAPHGSAAVDHASRCVLATARSNRAGTQSG